MKTAIAGGGITGLAFMNYLQKAGVDATLFEKKDEFNEKGSGLLLGINAMKILRELSLEEAVLAKGALLDTVTQADHHGEILFDMDLAHTRKSTGLPTVCISRSDLHAILAGTVESSRLRTGQEITKVEIGREGVTLHLASDLGKEPETGFDFVIGADGIHSKVRESTLGEEKLRYSGYTCWRFVIDAPPGVLQSRAWEIVGPGRRFGVFPQGQNKIYCFATLNVPAEFYRNAELSKEEFAALFDKFPSPVTECLEQLQNEAEATLIRRDIADLHQSRLHLPGQPLILAGDAGHATTPNLGQGAAMGLEDAAVFSQLLSENFSPVRLAGEFEKRRIKRVNRIRSQSRLMGQVGQLENRFLVGLRNLIMAATPAAVTRKSLESLLLHPSVFPPHPR